MNKKISFSGLAENIKTPASEQVNLLTKNEFTKLKDRPEESKAELVMVGVRMTKAERKALRSLSDQLEIPIQDLVRRGIALVRQAEGLR